MKYTRKPLNFDRHRRRSKANKGQLAKYLVYAFALFVLVYLVLYFIERVTTPVEFQ